VAACLIVASLAVFLLRVRTVRGNAFQNIVQTPIDAPREQVTPRSQAPAD
jgi:DHA1 family tetracycline resistance protein-like MFS transporter